MSDNITLSNKTMTALADLLSKHREGIRGDLERTVGRMGGSAAGGFMGGHGGRGGTGGGTLKDQSNELSLLIKNLRKAGSSLSAYEKYMLESARKQMKSVQDQIEAEKKLTDVTNDSTAATADEIKAREKHTEATRNAQDTVREFGRQLLGGSVAIKGFRELVDEMRTSYKLGMKWNPVTDALNAVKMGMDPKEMMEFQAQFRRSSGAFNGGMKEFNRVVADNQTQMVQYTGSMKSAAVAMGNMYEISHSMGLSLGDVSGSASDLFSQFKRMNAATSLTIDQFTDLTKSLINDSDIRSKLLTLQGQQRSAYIQGLLKQQDMLQAQGMTFEAAQKFVKFVESNSNKDPLERMKQGAQMQNVARMLGMSSQDAARFNYLQNKQMKSVAETDEFKKLGVDFTQRAHKKMGEGPEINGVKQGEILVRRVLSGTGIDLSPWEDAAAEQSAKRTPGSVAIQNKEIQERSDDWLQKIYKQTTIISDILGSFSASAAGMAIGGIALSFLMKKGGKLDSIIESLTRRALGGAAAGAAGAGAGGLGDPAGGGPGAGPGPAPGPGGTGKWARFKAATGFGITGARLGAGALIGGVGSMAAGAIDPESHGENAQAWGVGKKALDWGSTGAAVGMAFGPMGALIGGGVFALAGAAKALWDYSQDYEGQTKQMIDSSTKLQSIDALRTQGQLDNAKAQLDTLKGMSDLTADQQARVKDLTGTVDNLTKKLGVSDQEGTLSAISALGPTGQALLKNQVTSGSDLDKQTAALNAMAGSAGMGNFDSKAAWLNNANQLAQGDGISKDMRDRITAASMAMKNGQSVDLDSDIRPLFNQAGQQTLATIQQTGQTQFGQIANGLSDNNLSQVVKDSIDRSAELDKQIADLQTKRDTAMPLFGDEFGTGLADVMQIDKQIAEAKAAKENQAKVAQALEDALSGNRQLSVVLGEDTLKQFEAIFKGKAPINSGAAANTGKS